MSNNEKENIQKLGELIQDIRMAMLTTVDAEGNLRSRPMATQNEKFDGELWFFTKSDSPKAKEIEADQKVNVVYTEPKRSLYVSVSGTATINRNREKMKELWNPLYKAWFPEGLDDPTIALLNVVVDQAEYWDTPDSKVVQLVGFAKAILTGKSYKGSGDHEKISL